MSTALPARLPAIDAVKAIASQLIVLHHLAFYGPMTDVVYPSAEVVVRWFRDFALLAVPAFLVIGGFFAARSLLARLADFDLRRVPSLLWGRYTRLMRPYAVAMACAVACAWLARSMVPHVDTPATPTLLQVVAHLFLLQDVLELDALSAGVWYVAIDFQLFVMLVLLVAATAPLRRMRPVDPAAPVLLACGLLIVMSLTWINRNPDLEIWAPYFFGAYGLGILAERLSTRPHRGLALALIAALTILALVIEWRGRVLVAGLTAVLLILSRGGRIAPAWADSPLVSFLGRISYSLFLIHYPVCLVVGAVVARLWPGNPALNAFGMLVAWLTSIAAAALLYRWAEQPAGAMRSGSLATRA
ncbi:MAG: acyltransferase [Rhodocyclales bacterium]|nr:acyltransferase [Rhodocyclales bacterium]